MKYIVEIAKEYEEYFKGILICGIAEGKFAVDVIAKEDLEELTSDYINEHFGDLQDTAYQKGINDGSLDVKQRVEGAYQRGFDDGKDSAMLPCDGCKWDTEDGDGAYCKRCSRNCLDNYEEKQKADDKIEVGDEVEWDNDFTCDRFIVTRIYQPYGKKEQCDGIDDDGDVYRAVLIESLVKTGRHFDIASILEDMRND